MCLDIAAIVEESRTLRSTVIRYCAVLINLDLASPLSLIEDDRKLRIPIIARTATENVYERWIHEGVKDKDIIR